MASDRLVEAFEAGAEGRGTSPPDLASRIRRALDEAKAALPSVRLDDEAFARHLGRHLAAEEDWARLRAVELGLAFACGHGDPQALARFEALFADTLSAVLRRFHDATVSSEDLGQVLRERLFVGGGGPKILEYAGQGLLENWLRVTALRAFTDAVRAAPKREVPLPDSLLEAQSPDDVELTYLKTHYRAELREAFERAVSALDGGSRNVLRQSVVQRLSIDQIGAIYGIHRATAARRLERAKEDLLRSTRAHFMDQLRVEEGEIDSIMNLIRSRLDLSVGRVLERCND